MAAPDKEITLVLAADMPSISDETSGKYAELNTLVEQTRATSHSTFFLFGGGSIGPSALSNLDRGSHIIDLLNELEPDAMGVAKREFSYFEDELSLRSYEAAFPIVASNIIDKRSNSVLDGLASYSLVTKGETTLGFISIVEERIIHEYLLKNIRVEDPEESVRKLAKKLKEQGADIIVLHCFFPFQFVPSLIENKLIDLAFVSSTGVQSAEEIALDKFDEVISLKTLGTAIVVKITQKNNSNIISSQRIALKNIAANNETQAQVNAYQFRLDRLLNDIIGHWDGEYTTRRESVRAEENAFANFVTDSMREFVKSDIAIINGGSIRGDKTYTNKTKITRQTIAAELPFRSTLKVVSISGSDLLLALESSLSGLDELQGTFPQISGMQIIFDGLANIGSRVKSVKIANKELDETKFYVLATTNYLAEGGDGYESFKNANELTKFNEIESVFISDLVQREITFKGKLSSVLDQRIINLASEASK